MNCEKLDWAALNRLREGFLKGQTTPGPYWRTESALASYDLTYGERIGWKWDHALEELKLRQWCPSHNTVLDWGCGSGVAGRRVLSALGGAEASTLLLWDHEPLAVDFAARRAREDFPQCQARAVTPGSLAGDAPIDLLVVSHVLNELSEDALDALRRLLDRASAVVWLEPGTSEISRALGTIRDALIPTFRVVAPCTHQLNCPMFAATHAHDWCHCFAHPPAGIFADADWVKFGQRAGIDLRALPYTFLALDRSPPPIDDSWSHVIGRPRHFKPYTRLLSCGSDGLSQLTVPKRSLPRLCKALERAKSPLVYRWHRDGEQITKAEPLARES